MKEICLKYNRHGFTLVELLVAISIIGLLAVVTATSAGQISLRARNAQRTADLKKIQYALERYHSDQGFYPSDLNIDSVASITNLAGTVYLAPLPHDPTFNAGGSLHYCYMAGKTKNNVDNEESSGGSGSNSTCDNSIGNTCQYYRVYAQNENGDPANDFKCTNGSGLHHYNSKMDP